MQWNPFKILSKRFLGIDVGTSAIKIVELSRLGDRKKLENYGEMSAKMIYEKPFRTFEKSTILFLTEDISLAIKAIIEETKISTKKAVFSVPDFSTFFTNFELPPLTSEELPQAVRYEARQHVPLPLSDVTLDWQIIGGSPLNKKKTKVRILLVAVPNEVINQYKRIAELSKLELVALEAEAFGLFRSLIGEDEKRVVSIIDIGSQSTTCSIIEKRVLKVSRSFDLAGNELTERISKGLGIESQSAEDLRKKYGLLAASQMGLEPMRDVKGILVPLVDLIIREVEKNFKNYYWTEGKEVEKIILAGGVALLPGLREYLQDYFKKEVEIANPFANIFCPPIIEKNLKEMGPAYAIAVGAAIRGLE